MAASPEAKEKKPHSRLLVLLSLGLAISLGINIFQALYKFGLEWTLDRVAAVSVSILGFILAAIYFRVRPRFVEDKEELKELTKKTLDSLVGTDQEHALDAVLKDYETTNNEIERRENITLIVGTILITGSLIILGNTATEGSRVLFPYALPSILLYVFWLFTIHLTASKMDDMAYNRAKAIEAAIREHFHNDFGIHEYALKRMKNKGEKLPPWVEIRRDFWGIILIVLSASWLLISIFK